VKLHGYVPIMVAAVLIVSAALVQGLWSDRWVDVGQEAQTLAERLEQVPESVGPWQSDPLQASVRELQSSGAVGHVSRIYRHRETGEQVSLFIICGHMRDIAVHTPDRCYPAAGYQQLGSTADFELAAASGAAQFRTAEFLLQAPDRVEKQRVYWAWGYDGQWIAPDTPRLEFGGVRGLYKMYLIAALDPTADSRPGDDSCAKFGRDLLPLLGGILFKAHEWAPERAGTSRAARPSCWSNGVLLVGQRRYRPAREGGSGRGQRVLQRARLRGRRGGRSHRAIAPPVRNLRGRRRRPTGPTGLFR